MKPSYSHKGIFGNAGWSSSRLVRKLKNHLGRSKFGERKLLPYGERRQVDACTKAQRLVLEVGHPEVGLFQYLIAPDPLLPRALFPPP
ncbi:hypothetical protein Tco_0061855 [Tanacetum coccineum]